MVILDHVVHFDPVYTVSTPAIDLQIELNRVIMSTGKYPSANPADKARLADHELIHSGRPTSTPHRWDLGIVVVLRFEQAFGGQLERGESGVLVSRYQGVEMVADTAGTWGCGRSSKWTCMM